MYPQSKDVRFYATFDNRTPQWQPISELPLIAEMIGGMLETATENYATLQEARPKPYILDDYTVNRVIKLFSEQQEDLWLYNEQLRRWQAGKLTSQQSREVTRLQAEMKQLTETIANILALAAELKRSTIEAQLAKSDLQVGLETLLRNYRKEQ